MNSHFSLLCAQTSSPVLDFRQYPKIQSLSQARSCMNIVERSETVPGHFLPQIYMVFRQRWVRKIFHEIVVVDRPFGKVRQGVL